MRCGVRCFSAQRQIIAEVRARFGLFVVVAGLGYQPSGAMLCHADLVFEWRRFLSQGYECDDRDESQPELGCIILPPSIGS